MDDNKWEPCNKYTGSPIDTNHDIYEYNVIFVCNNVVIEETLERILESVRITAIHRRRYNGEATE